jgi:RHS repeat-associated protein
LAAPAAHRRRVTHREDAFDRASCCPAHYGDGLPNANPTWSYDAAGNRNDATVVDNLNRATTIGGVSRTYDILGNTLSKPGVSYDWDALNRMTGRRTATLEVSYAYRADGMRVAKYPVIPPLGDGPGQGGLDGEGGVTPVEPVATFYRYDGQMLMEDQDTGAGKLTRYGLGARGIDYLALTTTQGTTEGYPVYDAHGNMVATLAKSGGGYQVSDRRAYDAWGIIRQGNASGEPKGRYCASLGHVQDDESGLVYMRARYYEPSSGRFISEDIERQHLNLLVYCSNDPINRIDTSGCADSWFDSFLDRMMDTILKPLGYAEIGKSIARRLAAKKIAILIGWLEATGEELRRKGAWDWSYGAEMLGASRGGGSMFGGFLASGAGKVMTRGVLEITAGYFLYLLAKYLEFGI